MHKQKQSLYYDINNIDMRDEAALKLYKLYKGAKWRTSPKALLALFLVLLVPQVAFAALYAFKMDIDTKYRDLQATDCVIDDNEKDVYAFCK